MGMDVGPKFDPHIQDERPVWPGAGVLRMPEYATRIDPQHMAWVLEGLVDGEVRNRIVVDAETSSWAKVALERMLAIT